ncbi:MAG: hypothetical protein LYZ70_01645 [Nitrososphaerales archaeon]|nr:hypothetical protein [Nitrososphaerales archaeon]
MEKDQILDEIRKAGMLSSFWIGLSSVPLVLDAYWHSFSNLLNSGTIPKQTKMLINYECALADGCPMCVGVDRASLVGMGMSNEAIEKLEKDIKGSGLDEQTRNILIYSYHVAKNPHDVDENFYSAFKALLGDRRLIEVAGWVSTCSSILNITHSLRLHK